MMNEFFQKLSDNHPFITVCSYAGQEYIGIIQNKDDNITTFYDYGAIVEQELKKLFLELGDTWWWESNRLIPINIFLRDDWLVFKPYLRTFNNKGLNILHGPTTSISDLAKKRVKRRSITLVKRMP
jgi:hypothetical protein